MKKTEEEQGKRAKTRNEEEMEKKRREEGEQWESTRKEKRKEEKRIRKDKTGLCDVFQPRARVEQALYRRMPVPETFLGARRRTCRIALSRAEPAASRSAAGLT